MKHAPAKSWTPEELNALIRSYQGAAILAAAAELDIFSLLAGKPLTARVLAKRMIYDLRGLTVLLNALAALRLLEKDAGRFSLSPGVAEVLTAGGTRNNLGMARHQATCMRRWGQLASVVKSGRPARWIVSVGGRAGDQEAFIAAMDNTSAPVADAVVQRVQPLKFRELLDIGGASGTWTIAFLQACPSATAILFDLPSVIPLADRRLQAAGLGDRVQLAPGDFTIDPLPSGADLAWVSAIVHQNSRAENRELFAKVFAALRPGGRIAIRDFLMADGRTAPLAGTLFAVNMLVGTKGGGTFTLGELRADLESAGFRNAAVLHRDEGMSSIIVARKKARSRARSRAATVRKKATGRR